MMEEGQESRAAGATARWTVTANISGMRRGGLGPGQLRTGTRLFSAGTKLYVGEIYWGMLETGHMIGLARNTRKFVNCVIPLTMLCDIRPTLVYSPGALRTLEKLECTFHVDGEAAAKAATHLADTVNWLRTERLNKLLKQDGAQSSPSVRPRRPPRTHAS